MNARQTWFGLTIGFLVLVILTWGLMVPPAEAQKARAEPRYEYKVSPFRVSPNDRLGDDLLGDDARATQFERLLNDYARDGWEPVIDLLNRSKVQTSGGAVTTADTVAFIAFRRSR